jgi:hypothetical protein
MLLNMNVIKNSKILPPPRLDPLPVETSMDNPQNGRGREVGKSCERN